MSIKRRIGDIYNIQNGYAFKTKDYQNAGIPLVRISNIQNHKIDLHNCAYLPVTYLMTYEDYIIEKDDLLIALSGATTGKIGVYKDDTQVLLNQRVGRISSIMDDKSYNSFLIYYLEYYGKRILRNAYGAAQPNISTSEIASLPFPLYPLHEQREIVRRLELMLSELESGMEGLKLAKGQLKVYRQSVLKDAFEGKLTVEWRRRNNPPSAEELLETVRTEREKEYQKQLENWKKASEKAEKSGKKKPSKPRKPTFIEEANSSSSKTSIPLQWANTRLINLAFVETGATPLRENKQYYENGTIPWVKSNQVNELFVYEADEKITEKAVRETNVKLFPKNTLILAMYGEGKTRGKCSELLIEATTNQALAGIIVDPNYILMRKYIKYNLLKNYFDIRRKSAGGVQPNLNLTIVKNINIPLCSLPEQEAVVMEIEKCFSAADKLEEAIEEGLKKGEALRQSILKQAFEGKLTEEWRKENPELITGENSAEVLLEKIQKEKEQQKTETKPGKGEKNGKRK